MEPLADPIDLRQFRFRRRITELYASLNKISATFDGLSTVTITLSQDTIQAVATPVTWSGTYSVQADCVAVVNITSSGGPTFNVMLYNQGKNFLLTGSDATYTYSGSGNAQPAAATCSTSTLNGVYTFNAAGFTLASNAVSGVGNGAGLLQFDGQGNVTLNLTVDRREHQQRIYRVRVLFTCGELHGIGHANRLEFPLPGHELQPLQHERNEHEFLRQPGQSVQLPDDRGRAHRICTVHSSVRPNHYWRHLQHVRSQGHLHAPAEWPGNLKHRNLERIISIHWHSQF